MMSRWRIVLGTFFILISVVACAEERCTTTYKGIILFCFGGRKRVLEIHMKYVLKMLEVFDEMIYEYHLWDVAWSKSDSEYIRSLATIHPKVKVLHSPFIENTGRATDTASRQFSFIYSTFYRYDVFRDYIFLKMDDDIVFVDLLRFPDFIFNRINHVHDAFLFSANVVNNDFTKRYAFHQIHPGFLSHYGEELARHRVEKNIIPFDRSKRLSINFVSFMGSDLKWINEEFDRDDGSDDEYRLHFVIPNSPQLNLHNMIDAQTIVVHFFFGGDTFEPSEYGPWRDVFLAAYHELAVDYFASISPETIQHMKSSPGWSWLLSNFKTNIASSATVKQEEEVSN